MGEINILYEDVIQRVDELRNKVQNVFGEEIIGSYRKIEQDVRQSEGESIEIILEVIEEEYKTLTEIATFMEGMLCFIQDATDSFQTIDIDNARKIKRER